MNPDVALGNLTTLFDNLFSTMGIVREIISFFLGLVIILLIYLVVSYIVTSYTLQKVSEFLDHPYPWTAWFPPYKKLLITQLSEKPWWWLLLFYVLSPVAIVLLLGTFWISALKYPVFLIIILLIIILCIMLAEILNKIESPAWWCILLILPVVNLVLCLVICNDLNSKEKPQGDFAFSLPDSEDVQPLPKQDPYRNQYAIPKGTGGTLVVIQGELMGKGYRLDKNTIYIIGRAGNIALPMDDKTVSREHARIRFENDKFVIYDLGSTNKTRVNNQIISRKVLINGDEIKIGKTLFKFQWKRS